MIQRIYFERASQEQVAKELNLSVRRIQDIKAQAIDELVEMYAFTASIY
ncbi:sigma factor-like helix-turn-helix DNA-binding protein [uncultured Dysosmobacter sp.]